MIQNNASIQFALSQNVGFKDIVVKSQTNEEVKIQLCAVCDDKADGIHYGILSCRSCCAFFRRSCVHGQKYVCRFGGNCNVSMGDRCVCRYCRFNKCLKKGMQVSMVQPKRDPTGSQKNRKVPKKNRRIFIDANANPSSVDSVKSEATVSNGETFLKYSTDFSQQISQISSTTSPLSEELATFFKENEHCEIKRESEVSVICNASTSNNNTQAIILAEQQYLLSRFPEHRNYTYGHFLELVKSYREHVRMMELELTSVDHFMSEGTNPPALREFQPEDVNPLSKAELSGLMWFIEKLDPYKYIDQEDRKALLQRYSVRKLILDHIYVASKYTEELEKNNWVMLNRAYVPPTKTGFEHIRDFDFTKSAIESRRRKFQILRPTIDKILTTVVKPFNRMEINDFEITVLHLLLMWSIRNNRFINSNLKPVLRIQREWAIRSLSRYYEEINHPEAYLRLGQILLLLPEIEVACDMHCQDFSVAKLFEYADMSDYWYEKLCYSKINIK
uniref:Nuclear receptor n=1 Tax=Parastrongyloides trichosuri TaxID=131310 RepID=A0A0N4Z0E9_PARTI